MSRDSAKAHYTKQPGDPDEGFITASDAQAAIDDIYDDMSAPAVIADGSVTSGKIAADAVGSAQIATGAVGSGELATDAVTSDKIADGAVSNAHVASDAAIAASKVAGTAVTQADTGTVTNGMLAGSIAKTKVAGTAITAADTGTVTGTMIAAGAVDNGNLAANAVNAAKIASGAVTTVKIEDDAVTTAKIAADAVTSAEIAANAVGASELADNAVDTAAIAADAVTADKIANDTITAAELAANSVGTSELANDSVTAAKILDGTITANEIQNATITGAKLVNDTITATQIAADAVGSSEIAADAVGSSELANNAVDTAAVADAAITTAKVADGAVTAAKLARQPGNLLSENQASVETDTTGWVVDGGVTLSKESAPASHGSASLLASCTGTGAGQFSAAGSRIAVTAGETVTFMFDAHAGVGTRQVQALLLFYTAASGGTLVGGDSVKGPLVTTAGSWKQASLVTVVPATATHVVASVGLVAGGATDAVYFDRFSLHRGAGGKWQLPGVPIPGQSEIATNDAVNLSGTGSPEGVVTAAPGSTWLQTDATTDVKGWLRWIKATGTGNTGWVVGPEADTGWRSLTLENSWTGTVLVRRHGSTVWLVVDGATATSASSGVLVTLPTGFKFGLATVRGMVNKTDLTLRRFSISSGAVTIVSYQASDVLYVTQAIPTNEAWPTSLPGSAA